MLLALKFLMKNTVKINLFLTFFMLFMLFKPLKAQISESFTIDWKQPTVEKISKYDVIKRLNFEDGIYEQPLSKIPLYRNRIKGGKQWQKVNLVLNNIVVGDLTSDELEIIKNETLNNDFQISANVEIERKVPFTGYFINPIRYNPSKGKAEKLLQASASISYVNQVGVNPKSQIWASQSLLADGTWYKIATKGTGVNKITRSQLNQMGVPANADPRFVKLYGNGGNMLPESCSAVRPDDLVENAIYFQGENDGVLNDEDFILFYAQGNIDLNYIDSSKQFEHQLNCYADTSYYFVTYNTNNFGKRITSQPENSNAATFVVNTTQDCQVIENEEFNVLLSGRRWFGNEMNFQNSTTFNFSLPSPSVDSVLIEMVTLSRNNSPTTLNFTLNGTSIGSSTVLQVSLGYLDLYGRLNTFKRKVVSNASNYNITVNKSPSTSTVYVDYLRVNYTRALNWNNSFNWMGFRNGRNIGGNAIAEYQLANASNDVKIWDISNIQDVKSQNYTLNGSTISYKASANVLKEYVAINLNANFPNPAIIGNVINQNLHGLSGIHYIVVTPPEFMAQANQIVSNQQNDNNFTAIAVTPQQIYNEFSSGQQDVVAIRNFFKMLYDKANNANDMPKFVLFLGRGTYDFKNIKNINGITLPIFQSNESLSPTSSYATDDFCGLLDDNEGATISGNLDIGIGRLPISSNEEIANILNKIQRYRTSLETMDDWRNVVTLIADDQDSNTHLNAAEDEIGLNISNNYPVWNLDKIYLDAFQQQTGAGGQLYPDVNTAIDQRVQKGSLIVNYSGHGGEESLALERIITIPQINSYTNNDKLAFWITATCEFTRLDNPSFISAGEYLITNPNGGAIGLLTTIRLAFSGATTTITNKFFDRAFQKINNEYPTLGEAFYKAKNTIGISPNAFTSIISALVADPGMKLAYPRYNVITTAITTNNQVDVAGPDTIKALDLVKISGELRDFNNQLMTDFNGICTPTVFDKKITFSTLNNDSDSPVRNFSQQKNVVYRGDVSVINGKFTFEFIVPSDIVLNYGAGKISYYAKKANSTIDAHGYDNTIIVGGINPNPIVDNTGPDLRLYMNNEQFVFGGMTDENPDLFAILSDSSGINTVGTGIGHDLTAVLDNKTNETIVLNDFYKADLDNFRRGTVRFPFKDLAEGRHTLKMKAWDVANNSAEAYTEFIVVKNSEAALQYVLNYPNPFTTNTQFMFNHNQPGIPIDVQVQIFTVSGKMIKSIDASMQTDGYRSEPIPWNGLDEYGDKIGRGVYVYRLKIKTRDGKSAEKIEKLVILN